MNTADRSVALLDAALRRRFAFIELMPDPQVLRGARIEGLPLSAWLQELNRRVVRYAGRDGRNLQIGHSYLMEGKGPITDAERFVEVLRDDILPLLHEYLCEDIDVRDPVTGTTTARVDLRPVVLPHLLSAIEDDGARAGERRAAWVRELALGEPARRS